MDTVSELQRYVDQSQLTVEFGGSLLYDHQDWVRFRMVGMGVVFGWEGSSCGWVCVCTCHVAGNMQTCTSIENNSVKKVYFFKFLFLCISFNFFSSEY